MEILKGIIAFAFWFIGILITLMFAIQFFEDAELFGYSIGQFLMLLSIVIALVAAFFLSYPFFKPLRKVNGPPPGDDVKIRFVMRTNEALTFNGFTTHGTAHFLSDQQKESYTSISKGFFLGGGFAHEAKGHCITIAPTQTGKTRTQGIPAMLMPGIGRKASFVVYDPKGSIVQATVKVHKRRGQKIILLDPFHVQHALGSNLGIAPASFNPLELLHILDTNIVSATSRLVAVMLPDAMKDADNDFTAQARDLLEYIILHVMTCQNYEDKRNLITVFRLINQSDWEFLFSEMLDNDALDGLISDAGKKYANLKIQTERTFGSTVFSLGRAINWLKDPEMQKSLARCDFDPFNLERGGLTIYITLPFDKTETFAVWTRILFDCFLRANGRPSRQPKEYVYYLMDEFPSMGRFLEIKKAMAQYAEYNMRIWLFVQELSQLDRIYGKEGREEIIGLCAVFLAFKINSLETAEYISKRLGSRTERYLTRNSSDTDGTQTGTSHTSGPNPSNSENSGDSHTHSEGMQEVFIERKLMLPDEVMREENIIAIISGIGNMRLRRWFYMNKPKDMQEAFWWYVFNRQIEDAKNDTDNTSYEMVA